MAEYDQIMRALRNADAAGDADAARRLAQMAVEARAQRMVDDAGGAPGRIQAAKEGTLQASPKSLEAAAKADRIAEDRMTLAREGTFRSGVASAGKGIPFVGQWLDEAVDFIEPGQGEAMRQAQAAFERENPKTALAGQIGVGVASAIPAGVAIAGKAMQGANMATQALRGAGMAAAAGGAEGVVSGAGAAGEGRRASGALAGGVIGAGLGGVFGGLAPVVGRGAKSIAQRVKKLDVRTIMDEMGISAPAARVVKNALVNDDLDAAARAIGRGGDQSMLADAGPATRNLLDTASQAGGGALAVTRGRVDGRATEAGTRFVKALDDTLGVPRGVSSTAEGIASATSRPRQIAYRRAYETPIDYAGAGRQIEDVLSRIPPRTVQAAVNEANDAMRAAGVTNRQILAEIADDGAVTFREMPNVQQLDEIKKALGEIANREVDQFGRKTAAGNRAARLAAQLRDAISEAVPAYKNALRLGGDKLQMDEAFDMGLNLLSPRTSLEDVVKASKTWRSGTAGNLPVPMNLAGAPTSSRDAAKQGLREGIERVMGKARTTLAEIEAGNFDFETGQNAAKEALDALRALTTPDNFKKARLVLGTDAKKLFDELQKTSDAMALRAAVARNSATAIRQATRDQVQTEVAPSFLRRVLGRGGNPLEATREITEALAGIDPRSMGEAEQQIMTEIADALTRIRGPQAERAIRVIDAAMRGQPIKTEEAQAIGRLIGGSASALGYQTGTQLLRR